MEVTKDNSEKVSSSEDVEEGNEGTDSTTEPDQEIKISENVNTVTTSHSDNVTAAPCENETQKAGQDNQEPMEVDEPSTQVTTSTESRATASVELHATPISELDATPITELGATTISELHETPITELHATPITELHATTTPITESNVIPDSESRATPSTESHVTPSSDSQATPSTEAQVTPSSDSQGTPSAEAQVTSGSESQATPRTDSLFTSGIESQTTPKSHLTPDTEFLSAPCTASQATANTESQAAITESRETPGIESPPTSFTESQATPNTESHVTSHNTESHATSSTESHITSDTDSHVTLITESHTTPSGDSHVTLSTESHVTSDIKSPATLSTESHITPVDSTAQGAVNTLIEGCNTVDGHSEDVEVRGMEGVQSDVVSVQDEVSGQDGSITSADQTCSNLGKETPKDKDPICQGSNEMVNENDSNTDGENPVFVHVNTEKDDKEDNDKPIAAQEQDEPDIDPIGSSDWTQNNESELQAEDEQEGECIIPDSNRVLTQEEKDAATTIRDPPDLEQPKQPSSISEIELPADSENPEWKGKYVVNICTEISKKCMICEKETKTKYTCTLGRKQTFICSEGCLKRLKEQNAGNVIIRDLRVKNFGPQEVDNLVPSYNMDSRHCVECGLIIRIMENLLSWETLDFCSEACLTKYQKRIGSYCFNCNLEVSDNFLGKYCVRFGYNIRQFCSSNCLEEHKKGLKVCSYCQKDMSGSSAGFLASIGDKGLFKDFCSAQCMEKYNAIIKNHKGAKPRTGCTDTECCVCHKVKPVEIEFELNDKVSAFCSEPCVVAFKFVNKVEPQHCEMCLKYVLKKVLALNSMFYEGIVRHFCSKTCMNIYVTTYRKIVSCCWCKVKKYNFDMIQRRNSSGEISVICSLNCLQLHDLSTNASNLKKRCESCLKPCKGQYYMTLPDSSVKNFCSGLCLQSFQNLYAAAGIIVSSPEQSTSQSVGKRTTRKSTAKAPRKQIIPDMPGPLPIITSVRSLAPTSKKTSTNDAATRSLRSKTGISSPVFQSTPVATVTRVPSPPRARKIILVRPPDIPSQRNVATMVKPITVDVAVDFKPLCFDKAVQTDNLKDSLVIVPIPVPIYVPSPMHMYSIPFPVPVPFPLPIPVPVFIPTTKNTSDGILKEIKKIQVRTPTDPYEADLLMMAELVAVAEDKKEEPEETESDVGDVDTTAADEAAYSPEPPDTSNTFGEDMLQMALKMATDFEEPAVDLEGALTASTITATQGNEAPVAAAEQADDPPPIQPTERPPFRGRKRGRPARNAGRGRGRGRPPNNPVEVPIIPPQEPETPTEPVEKPDANMCLKYTFGVNAWKQWVTTKNAELEKTSRKVKLFKTEILQLTSDELNFSLCLFVKEVRKPNGAEYAPDTIYYLCLGIQQYLFENARIDNIFCDSYYEKFTECLDEVCRKFSSLYNDSQYIVTRVEEEHLWESKQLGAHSPHVLLSTLMFFNTKHFNLTNVEEHMQLSFSHIMKHWKRVPNQPGTPKAAGSRNILLRFYPPQSAIEGNLRKKKVYEQQENEDNPLRCPVKLYEFYLSKCPESVKTRNDVFYLLPERSCVPDSPVWYSTMALGKEALEKMLHRVKMVKEINVALLAS